MWNILNKEFVVQRTIILAYTAVVILFAARLMPIDEPVVILTMLAIYFTFSNAAHDEKNNSHVLLNSLPVDRKEIVTAKYVFHLVIGVAFIGLGLLYRVFFGGGSLEASLWQTGIAIAVVVWFVSVFFPMYYWLGPRFVQIGMIVLFLLMITALPMAYHLGMKHQFWGIADVVRSIPVHLLVVFVSAVTVAVLVVSRFLSVWLYERKQF